jgi:Signal recognition particle GTPase
LIEKAETAFEEKKAIELQKKISRDQMTLEDLLDQMEQLSKMGDMGDILKMLPGGSKIGALSIDEKQMAWSKAIVQSMTTEERRNPNVINGSRRKRIAAGSGTKIQDVNRLLNQFEQMKKMLKQFSGKKGRRGMFNMPF